MTRDLGTLSAAQLLAAAESNVSERRQAEVDQLLLVLEWCDRNGEDPQRLPGAVPVALGGDKLVRLGGDGTPMVAEMSVGELAIAFGSGDIAMQNLAAAALDLRHRFPLLWVEVQALRMPVWLARKVTTLAKELSPEAAGVVDAAVSAAVDQSPSRVLRIAEAKVIEADLDAHRARVAADAARTGCWLSRTRPGDIVDALTGAEAATRRITAKLPVAAATDLDAAIEDLADALAAHQALAEGEDPATHEQLRAQALTLLADPHAAVAFLDGPDGADAEAMVTRRSRRRKAVVHVHLSAWALDGVARVEGLGPMLVEQLGELLGRRDIALQPVLDLAGVTSVNAYEHPTAVRQRAIQRMCGDVFPHSANGAGVADGFDLDHAAPYVPPDRGGPPDQTGDLNAAPLTRRHHRFKTHGHVPDGGSGYQVRQFGLSAYRWVTPHGLARWVTPRGTTRIELIRDDDGTIIGELHPPPPGLQIKIDLDDTA